MKIAQSLRSSHQWNRYVVLRVALGVGSLVSLILASGAGSYWN